MKLKEHFIQQPALIVGLLFLLACTHRETAPPARPVEGKIAAKKEAGHFAFYKNIALKPGLNFEVVSWGRGADSTGAYLLLMSDSLKNNYRSLSVERRGIITDAWNMDLDNDGNPEIYVELLSGQHTKDLNVYEYSGNSFNKISFPSLTPKLKKNYGGNDQFLIKNGELFRTFPVVNSTDSSQQNGSAKMILYRLRGNTFSAEEITK